ncbi:protein of unknown function [Seinonella peptonophila]|uniref:DUF1885 family protein n=1 Tax=Seinonella peptonophila TaxID=112248 RepID=A0A1M4V1N6_9BACL|nr:DUF1885 family protein [Seinonella peptonophila]SHE62896.1 protein of unknown function [Seinonella peptonophila]
MSQSAFIQLVDGAKKIELDLKELEALLLQYQEMTANTGKQLGWDYQQAAFPYEVQQKTEPSPYLFLKGKEPHLYQGILMGVSKKENGVCQVQITLSERSTQGDQAKGNELSRYLAKELGGKLHLFNKRIMYFNKRK